MNRIDRVTAILIQLQSKRVVKAQEIAERFGMSLRTVYRDIRTLEEAGVPIIGEAGIGYSIVDGYRLPPVMFTTEEATAFLTAEKLVEKMTDGSTDQYYKSAMYKVKAVLKNAEKEFLEDLDERIKVLSNPIIDWKKIPNNALQVILKSIIDKRILAVDYFASHNEQQTERQIEPMGVYYAASHWHLIAYCQLRKDYRDFRLDRIKKIVPTNQLFRNRHPSLQEYFQAIAQKRKLETLVILVEKSIMKYVQEQKFLYGCVQEIDCGASIEMTFLYGSLDTFGRWMLMFGDFVEIVSPPALAEKVKSLVEVLSKKYEIDH